MNLPAWAQVKPIYQKSKFSFVNLLRHETLVFTQLLKTTTRQLSRNRSISFINISGLAIGMATAILIFLWIANQLSYDQFHVNKDPHLRGLQSKEN